MLKTGDLERKKLKQLGEKDTLHTEENKGEDGSCFLLWHNGKQKIGEHHLKSMEKYYHLKNSIWSIIFFQKWNEGK